MTRHPTMFLTLAAALVLGGCSSSDEGESTGESSNEPAAGEKESRQSPEKAQAAANRDDGRGSGTLRLGDETYEFQVRVCDLSGETDGDYQTLVGHGKDGDGEDFEVFVSRNDVKGMITHSVSFQQGEVHRGQGTVIESMRVRQGERWQAPHGGPAEPLVQIDGQKVTARGNFTAQDAEPGAEAIDGVLEATCAQQG